MQLIKDLERLTPKEIAQKLEELNIRGNRRNHRACPIAEYVTQSSEEICGASVGRVVVVYHKGGTHENYYLEPNSSVKAFIHLFDAGEFPQLDARRVL